MPSIYISTSVTLILIILFFFFFLLSKFIHHFSLNELTTQNLNKTVDSSADAMFTVFIEE